MVECEKCADSGLREPTADELLEGSGLYEGPDGEVYIRCECQSPRFAEAIRGIYVPIPEQHNG